MQHPAYSQLRPVTESAAVVLCTNPSYAALEGTNSWIVRRAGDERSIVVDPGPEDEGHLNVLHAKAGDVAAILLTHRHPDHCDGAHRFRQLTGAPVRAFDPRYCSGGEPMHNGEVIALDGVTPRLEVVHTPGHTQDSTCFFVWSGDVVDSTLEGVMTGDTIAGRHTTMISETDGELGAYLTSLEMLERRGQGVTLLPGHGPENPDLSQLARKYIDRRHYRLRQIKEVWSEHGKDIEIGDLVNLMYDDVDPVLRGAAEQSTRVALRYLEQHPEAL